jgi:hypothetical protein
MRRRQRASSCSKCSGAFAEFERSMIRQRVKLGLKRAVAQGTWGGHESTARRSVKSSAKSARAPAFYAWRKSSISAPAPFTESNVKWKPTRLCPRSRKAGRVRQTHRRCAAFDCGAPGCFCCLECVPRGKTDQRQKSRNGVALNSL